MRHGITVLAVLWVTVLLANVTLYGVWGIQAKANTPPFANLVSIDSPSIASKSDQIAIVFVIDYQLELGAKIRTRIISPSNMVLKELVHLIATSARRTDRFPLLLPITDNTSSIQRFNATVEYETLEENGWAHSSEWQTQFSVQIVSAIETSTTIASTQLNIPTPVLVIIVILGPLLFVVGVVLLRRKLDQNDVSRPVSYSSSTVYLLYLFIC